MARPKNPKSHCLGCGRELPYRSAKKGNLRCKACEQEQRKEEVLHCLDCGKELTKRAKKAGGKRCRVCSNKHKLTDINYKANHKASMQLLAKDQEWLEKRRATLKRQQEDPVISKRTREALLRLHSDPAWKANQRRVMEQVKNDPTYSDKQVRGFRKWLKGWSKSRTTIESKVLTTLKGMGVKFVDQKEFKGYFYDFYLPDQKVLIEVDGCFWHGCSECGFKRSGTNNDEAKNQLAIKLGMTLLRLPEHSINANPYYVREALQSILDR